MTKRWRCKVCGYVHEGSEPPDICPICGAPKSAFEAVAQPAAMASSDKTATREATSTGGSSTPVVPSEKSGSDLGVALAQVSYGLFVVTSRRGETFSGQTANTVFQVTSEPPQVILGINRKNHTHDFLAASGVAAVTILGRDNLDHVRAFGFRSGRDVDKFAGLDLTFSPEVKCPVLSDGLAYLEVSLDPKRSYDAGTHTLFLARVVGAGVLREGEPMTYAYYRASRSRAPAGDADLANSVTALNLEFGANRRYEYQIAELRNPRLNAILEGVMRTEGDHVSSALGFVGKRTPESAKGFRRAELFLQLNLDFEKVAAETYGRFASEAADAERRASFEDMAQSERGHVNIFQQTLAEIRSGSFPVAFYCELCGWEVSFGPSPTEGAEEQCARCGAKFRLVMEAGEWGLRRLA